MKTKNAIFSILLTIILGGIYYYFTYPPINPTNIDFWVFMLLLFIIYTAAYNLFNFKVTFTDFMNRRYYKTEKNGKAYLIVPIIFGLIIVLNIILSPLFCSKQYYKRIKVSTGDFKEEVNEVNFNNIPLLDRDSSEKLGDRQMGQMSELVSQFDVSNQYTQINYNNEIVRVTPLEYNGIIKWFTNRKQGVTGYIKVNSTTGKSEVVKLKKGMKYVPSGLFNENVYRKLQLAYKTFNFGSVNFEIDNKGNPYWVASVIKYTGVGLRRDVQGIVILDPITGKSKYYDTNKVPKWVDHVYEADLIIEQINDWGKYKNGFINSLISQKDVVKTTSGYNYIAQNDDIYLYTGVTSVLSDESNIGFVLTNLRTKETKYYSVAGAEETSAMESAKGQVQQMNYTSTFPLLINLSGRPTYLISLKDNAGLVKMYAFVDVEDYQKVVVTDSSDGIKKAAENYLNEIGETASGESKSKEVVINNLTTANIDGNTYYYFKDNEGKKYKVSIKIDKNRLPFLNNGDTINIKYDKDTDVITITAIE